MENGKMMNRNELEDILKVHVEWIRDNTKGRRADLQDADLQDADLRGANLQYADLRGANLYGADLRHADLRDANLRGADLRRADLQYANLMYADLRRANLQYANLLYADLRDAYLRGAYLRDANLRGADLRDADLHGASLQRANLRNANLRRADLHDANLYGANLRGAELRDADLRGAVNLRRQDQASLSILKHQKGRLTAFKYLNGCTSPYQDQEYEIGKEYEVEDYNTDERILCAEGVNVATLDWCLQDTGCDLTKTYIEVEFNATDIAAIPYNTDGKFRVRKLRVIRRLTKEELIEYIKPMYPTKEKEEKEDGNGNR